MCHREAVRDAWPLDLALHQINSAHFESEVSLAKPLMQLVVHQRTASAD